MRTRISVAAAALAALLTACGDKEPEGQVVARVGGQEVTVQELSRELAGFSSGDPAVRKQAMDLALQQVLQRKVLAEAARKTGVANRPEFALEQMRVQDTLVIDAWKAQLTRQVPDATPAEVRRYIDEHPDTYAARKIFEVDQIRFSQPGSAAIVQALQPANSLAEVAQILSGRGVSFQAAPAQFDTLAADPKVTEQIAKMQPGEVFIMPAGALVVVSQIRNVRIEPVVGDAATRHAVQTIKVMRSLEAQRRQFDRAIADAKDEIVYNKAYRPGAAPAPKTGG